jgi:ubiquinone/menaquinone biosynthesis C-methylase UbiE
MSQLQALKSKATSLVLSPRVVSKAIIPASSILADKIFSVHKAEKAYKKGTTRYNQTFSFPLVNLRYQPIQPYVKMNIQKNQMRLFSDLLEHVSSDEEKYNHALHLREIDMHRHKNGPIARMLKLTRDMVKDNKRGEFAVVDISSQPPDEMVQIAKEFPVSSISYLAGSTEDMKDIADLVLNLHLPNVAIQECKASSLDFDDSSIDLVTSCYGLQKTVDPAKILKEVHRVLKPGGTLIIAALDHLETEPIVNKILHKVSAGTSMENASFKDLPTSLTKPRALTQLIEKAGLRCIDVEHGEYPIYLSNGLRGAAFDVLTFPIKEQLEALRASGENKYAFEDARAVFDDMIKKADMIKIDSKGRIVVDDNRYEIVVARRMYEDTDTFGHFTTTHDSRHSDLKSYDVQFRRVPLDGTEANVMSNDFFNILNQTLSDDQHHYSPFSPLKHAIEDAIRGKGQDAKCVKVLDIGSRLSQPKIMIADSFPSSRIHSVDLESEERIQEEISTGGVYKGLDIGTSQVDDEKELSAIPDNSVDIITSSFGLTFYRDPKRILDHIHRILKPGGTFITTTWDSISLEHIGTRIMGGVMNGNINIPIEIANLDDFSIPHKLEHLIEDANLGVKLSEHYEFPLVLSHNGLVTDGAFETAILTIRPYLEHLVETGANPDAFIDARKVFEKMVKDGDLLNKDTHGCLLTNPNRYHLLVARRNYEGAYSPLHK